MERVFKDPIERERYELRDVFKLTPGAQPWSATVLQTCALEDVSESVFGKAWYDRRIGVRVQMLGEPGTTVFVGKTPESRTAPGREGNKGERSTKANEVGGTTLIVERRVGSTTFVALHEPFENATPRVRECRRIHQSAEAVVVAVTGDGFNDRLLYRHWKNFDQPVTVEGDGESFTFADRAFVRVRTEKVEAVGNLRQMRLGVFGRPSLVINGRPAETRCESAMLLFSTP